MAELDPAVEADVERRAGRSGCVARLDEVAAEHSDAVCSRGVGTRHAWRWMAVSAKVGSGDGGELI